MTKFSHIEQLIQDLCPSGVEYKTLAELLDYEQPTKYIVRSTEYDDRYKTPVLTAGQGFILGYTDETDGIYHASKENPTLIFDDFTTSYHWVDFDFKVKSSAMKMLRPRKDADIVFRYVYYAMLGIDYKPEEHARQWISRYGAFEIPVPPLPIQKEIVRIVDTFDNLIKNIDAEIDARQKELVLCRRHILNNLDCETKSISSLFLLRGGYTPSTKNPEFWTKEGGYPWYTMDDIRQNGRKLDESLRHITEKAIKGKGLFPTGTIVFATSATIGEHAILTRPALTNQRFTALIPKSDNVYMPFYYHYGFIVDVWCLQHIKQGGFASVDMNGFANLQIPLPSLKEQQAIAEKLDTIEAFIANLNEERALRQQQYEYYRAKLISLLK